MANTKGKIIIASGLVLVTGITTAIVVSHIRKKRVLKEIYDKINDTSTEEGQQALLDEENQILGSNAFDPNFYQKTTNPRPDVNLLMPTKIAREIANKIYSLAPNMSNLRLDDDEAGIVSQFKKLKSKGQVSQVASAFANPPLNHGDLADFVTETLNGWTDDAIYMKQLTTYINNLPN